MLSGEATSVFITASSMGNSKRNEFSLIREHSFLLVGLASLPSKAKQESCVKEMAQYKEN